MEISLGAAAFWLALAAVIIAGGWFKSRSEALKHETLRRLAEKTGQVDEAQLRLLLAPPPAPPMGCPPPVPPPGSGYRGLRIGGVVIASFGLGGMLAFWLIRVIVGDPEVLVGVALSAGAVVFGAGLFVSSRFAERPEEPGAKSLRTGDARSATPSDPSRAGRPGSPDRSAP